MSPRSGANGVRLRAALPRSTFWRFLLYACVIAVFTGAAALGASLWVGRAMVHDIHEEAGYNVLRNTVDLIGRHQFALEELENMALGGSRNTLRATLSLAASTLDDHCGRHPGENPSERANAIARMTRIFGNRPSVYVLDHENRFVAHPDPALLGTDAAQVSGRGDDSLDALARKARKARDGVFFSIYAMPREKHEQRQYMLAAAQYYAPGDMVLVAEAQRRDIEEDLGETQRTFASELRARISEITIGKSGYAMVFDDQCTLLTHPTMRDQDLSKISLPDGRNACAAFRDAARQPWGRNKLSYDWVFPENPTQKPLTKIAWCTREPTTGWVVAITAYVEELNAEILPRFFAGIFLPALLSILVLGGALALLLKNLLGPVRELTQTCQSVAGGDLTREAPEDVPGEIGFLCRHFNTMIRALRDLYRKEELRRRELVDLNRDLEKKVAIRTRALERKAHLLEESNARLKELDAMKSAFLSSVSHELRTPLTSILGFAKLIDKELSRHVLEADILPPKAEAKALRIRENVGIICQESDRLSRLVNDVLDLAKIESGRLEWRNSAFRLDEVVEQALATAGAQAEERGVHLATALPDDLPMLRADRDRIMQVVVNLLGNALKFTDEGAVCLTARARGNWIQVAISDTGKGIPTQDLIKVFDKFHQAGGGDTLLKKPEGTGLGLAICHNIIHHYGGLIWAESNSENGTTIFFELPAYHPRRPAAPRAKPVRAPEDGPRPGAARPGDAVAPLILVVDDEEPVRRYLAQLFESEGYRTAVAHDGAQAVVMARRLQPDLITMDILMPGMDGLEAMHRLRADPDHPHLAQVPIVAISALPDESFPGSDASFTKPVDAKRLMETVHNLLTRECGSHPCLVVGADETGSPKALVICTDKVNYCSVEELQAHLAAGFSGTVLVPANEARRIDYAALAGNKDIQIVVVPELKNDETV